MPNLYLVGFMGAGKSSSGRVLAARLGFRFLDLEEGLVERFGMSIPDVFERRGEALFREAERQALEDTTVHRRMVVATGGGAFCSQANRDIIHDSGGRSVYLDLPWEEVARRLAGRTHDRPKFTSLEAARQLFEKRRPHYARANLTVGLTGPEPPEAVAERIVEVVAGVACAI